MWLWASFASEADARSVPHHLENHADRIRRKYLAFIHELGRSHLAGKRVIDHLDRGDGESLWWMTLLAEKSPLKSPGIYTCLRLIALEEMLREERCASVALVSADRPLAAAVQRLCSNLNIEFRWRRPIRQPRAWSLRRIYDLLPHAVRGLISLRHVLGRWPLRAVRRPDWFSGSGAVFICSYFIHLDTGLLAQGRFHSRQWESLPGLLRAAGRPVNWLQLFLPSAAVRDAPTAAALARRFNSEAREQGCHAFLDSFLSVRTVLTALGCWIWLCGVCWRLRAIPRLFRPADSALWLWPVMRDDWLSSLLGTAAMSNCLAIALFDAALSSVPRQQTGLYLYENQAWEKAFLRAWRRHGHGEIIGVQHATVPFWHLYYFEDPRNFRGTGSEVLPLPDRLAANGMAAVNAFAAGEFPRERLVETEALRYLGLAHFTVQRGVRDAQARSSTGRSPTRVLVLGDLIPASMEHLLRLLEQSMPFVPPECRFTIKPHPGLDTDLAAYPRLHADLTREALSGILDQYDVAVSANCTSAAVDAFVAGLPVIIALDGHGLNLSPLRGCDSVRFVSSGIELGAALADARSPEVGTDRSTDFFYLTAELPRWKHLLAAPAGAQ